MRKAGMQEKSYNSYLRTEVIPAKAGIQRVSLRSLDSRFRGNDVRTTHRFPTSYSCFPAFLIGFLAGSCEW